MNTNIPFPTSSGAAVFDQIRNLIDADELDLDRRSRARYPWDTPLTIWVMDEPEHDRGVRSITVQTTDISTTGFGFVFRQYIHPGAILRTQLDVLPGKPIVDGIVAHCDLTDHLLHKVGVQFVNAT